MDVCDDIWVKEQRRGKRKGNERLETHLELEIGIDGTVVRGLGVGDDGLDAGEGAGTLEDVVDALEGLGAVEGPAAAGAADVPRVGVLRLDGLHARVGRHRVEVAGDKHGARAVERRQELVHELGDLGRLHPAQPDVRRHEPVQRPARAVAQLQRQRALAVVRQRRRLPVAARRRLPRRVVVELAPLQRRRARQDRHAVPALLEHPVLLKVALHPRLARQLRGLVHRAPQRHVVHLLQAHNVRPVRVDRFPCPGGIEHTGSHSIISPASHVVSPHVNGGKKKKRSKVKKKTNLSIPTHARMLYDISLNPWHVSSTAALKSTVAATRKQ